jgi:hypothetical protein
MTQRFHYLTNDAVRVDVESPDGEDIGDDVTVTAGLGTAWRPPVTLAGCSWVEPAAPVRVFGLPINPAGDDIDPGVYSVWFRLSGPGVDPLSPLIRAEEQVVIFGGPVT